ncbi:MAG: AarF/ABC1/UbiB kinase family protein [Deltaproteobacteria bacterium]|nr:MAG: AarF/ABC1/UbiB kinase family protein [Deltaproteobacteria bacterium]
MSDRPPTRGKRLWKLASMSASVAGDFARTRLRNTFRSQEDAEADQRESFRRSGERIAETLGQLKGAAMKVGQMASVGADLLPRELSDALRVLQREAPPMPIEVIEEQIEREFGVIPERLFASFNPEPFAAASIGQVHRATTDDGVEVIVKVQYPGVDDSVDTDLNHLRFALRASGMVGRHHRDAFDRLFEELRSKLHEELDYTNEAHNLRLLREVHRDDPFVHLPEVIGERSAKRVLTLSFEDGTPLREVEDTWPQDLRNTIGANLVRLLARQIFDARLIHADPNPGNFAFRDDGTIVLYDYGCVKALDPDTMDAWEHGIRAGLHEDYEALDEALFRLGARLPDSPPVDADFYRPWRDIMLEPFLGTDYNFGEARLQEKARKLLPDFFRNIQSFQPPVELAFLDRTIGGHYGTLRRLRATGPWRDIVAPWIDLDA